MIDPMDVFERTLKAQSAMVAMTMAAAGTTVAMLRGPAVSIGTQQNAVFFPFGHGFSQDIDPVTTWLFPMSFGIWPATQKAAALVTEVRVQQELCDRLLARCEAHDRDEDDRLSATADAPVLLDRSEIKALRRNQNRLDTLTGRKRTARQD